MVQMFLTNGYGGVGVLNPWNGRSSEFLSGYGPGGAPADSVGQGQGATYSYNLDGALLVPGAVVQWSILSGSAGGGAHKCVAEIYLALVL